MLKKKMLQTRPYLPQLVEPIKLQYHIVKQDARLYDVVHVFLLVQANRIFQIPEALLENPKEAICILAKCALCEWVELGLVSSSLEQENLTRTVV